MIRGLSKRLVKEPVVGNVARGEFAIVITAVPHVWSPGHGELGRDHDALINEVSPVLGTR